MSDQEFSAVSNEAKSSTPIVIKNVRQGVDLRTVIVLILTLSVIVLSILSWSLFCDRQWLREQLVTGNDRLVKLVSSAQAAEKSGAKATSLYEATPAFGELTEVGDE